MRSKLSKNCLVILLALVMSVPVFQVLDPTEDAEAAGTTTTLRIGFLQKIDSLNPYIGVSDAAYVFYGLVYDALACVDNKLNVSPNLAMSTWTVPLTDPEMIANGLPYGSLWQYNLTSNATWFDGVPFTADDVVWNIDLNAGNYSDLWAFQPYSHFMQFAEKVDDRTVRIHFFDRSTGEPCPVAYGQSLSMYLLPRHKLLSYTAAEIAFMWFGVFDGETPPLVGTGPFVPTDTLFQDWLSGNPITLVKNPNYHFGPDHDKYVNFDQVQLKFYDDTVAMTYALRNNQLDIAQFPPAPYYELKKDVENDYLKDIFTYDGPKVTQYWTEIGICQGDGGSNPSRTDPIIKQALAQAVNKTYITENFYLGLADPGSTIIAPINSYWHWEPTEAERWAYNLSVAATLLQSNGYIDTDSDGIREATASSPAALNNLVPEGTPLEYEMLIGNEYPEEREIAYWLRNQWATIGIKITVLPVDEPTLNTIVYSYNYDFMIWYWSADIDPNYQLYTLTTMSINGWNDICYSDPAYDENYTNSVQTMDMADRKVYVDICQEIVYQDCSYIILAYPYQTYAWRTDTFVGWGNWSSDPGRSLDNYWTANPLIFDLLPMSSFDTEGPVTTLSVFGTEGDAGWYVSDVCFDFAAVDNFSSVDATYYRVDGQMWHAYDGTITWLGDGSHLIEFYSCDVYGNNETIKSAAVDVDSAAPWLHGTIALGELGDHGWYVTRPRVDLSVVADNLSGVAEVQYRMFGGDWQVYTSTFDIQETGTVLLQVTANDSAGNEMTAQEIALKVDPYAPVVIVNSEVTYDPTTVTVAWLTSENISGLDVIMTSLDGESFKTHGLGTSTTFAGLEGGTHTLIVRAVDKAGNIGEKTVTFTVEGAATSSAEAIAYALIGAAIAAAAIALMLIMRKRGKESSPPT